MSQQKPLPGNEQVNSGLLRLDRVSDIFKVCCSEKFRTQVFRCQSESVNFEITILNLGAAAGRSGFAGRIGSGMTHQNSLVS